MSREKILKYFKDINHAYNDCTRYDTLKRMLDELQEPCDDAISRQAVLNEIYNTDGISNIYFHLADEIIALPPVTPAEKVGQWIYIGNKDINQSVKIVECNVCHKRNMGSSDYCPSCGRKMQEVGE